MGGDLEEVGEMKDVRVEEVMRIDSEGEYVVYMVGFGGGFAFLGGMCEGMRGGRKGWGRGWMRGG